MRRLMSLLMSLLMLVTSLPALAEATEAAPALSLDPVTEVIRPG